jgi:hypothetical protein
MRKKNEGLTPGIVSLASIDDAGRPLRDAHPPGADDTEISADGTPDEDVVDELGKVLGVMYHEGEPLRLGRKEQERDVHRWELDPASAEDYGRRMPDQKRTAEPIRRMGHKDKYR